MSGVKMNYVELLRDSAIRTGSIACMGLDPVVETMPKNLRRHGMVTVPIFFWNIFEEMRRQRVSPGAFKPNLGFYTSHDRPMDGKFDGSNVLRITIETIEHMFPDAPIILDSKRGDIAASSANYATEGFVSWDADAVTVHPYMGSDSVEPFIEYCNDEQRRGVYILNRTSNRGARDFQGLGTFEARQGRDVYTRLLYRIVAERIIEWAVGRPGVGAVVGATSLNELSELAEFYSGKEIPLLIPGVGGQGGDAREVADRLRDAGYDLRLARINSSSGITHPWAKRGEEAPDNYAEVCVGELRKLNEAIGYIPLSI